MSSLSQKDKSCSQTFAMHRSNPCVCCYIQLSLHNSTAIVYTYKPQNNNKKKSSEGVSRYNTRGNKIVCFLRCCRRAVCDLLHFKLKHWVVRTISAKISHVDVDADRCQAAKPHVHIKCSTRPTEHLPLDTSEVTNEDKTRQITYARTKPPTLALTERPWRDTKHALYSQAENWSVWFHPFMPHFSTLMKEGIRLHNIFSHCVRLWDSDY